MTKLIVAFRNFADAPDNDLFADGLAGGLTNHLINFKLQDVRWFTSLYLRTCTSPIVIDCATSREVAGSIPDGATGIFH